MRIDSWLFSAKRAWQNPFIKWTAIATFALVFSMNGFYLLKLFAHARDGGTVVLHYNVYLGIDEVVAWPWMFFWPAVWFALTAMDMICAFGWYRSDAHLAISLIAFACIWALPWSVALYYLILANSV